MTSTLERRITERRVVEREIAATMVEEPEVDIDERVRAGATWLDEQVPGWAANIDLEKFDITMSDRCVLGQLYTDSYDSTLRSLFGYDEHLEYDLGFNSWGDDSDENAMAADFNTLQASWERAIAQRQLLIA